MQDEVFSLNLVLKLVRSS